MAIRRLLVYRMPSLASRAKRTPFSRQEESHDPTTYLLFLRVC